MTANTHTHVVSESCPTSLSEGFVEILFHTMKLPPNLEQTGLEKFIILSYVTAQELKIFLNDSDSY